jgi:aminomethyltransferase
MLVASRGRMIVARGPMSDVLSETPLTGLHRELGARLVPFAGYTMPVQYPAGILAEHLHCRAAASLFDVSHMGQATLDGPGAIAALERLTTGDFAGLAPGRMRYTLLTNAAGGILDDLIVARVGEDTLFLVVNASRKQADFAHIAAHLPPGVTLRPLADRALLALQGPQAAAVLARLAPTAQALGFMATSEADIAGIGHVRISRCGYTGEDGFEISVAADAAEALARLLLAQPEVRPAGLGARDSLRLEAGLPLHGNDIDATITPVEAGLGFALGKRRRGAWDFPGGPVVAEQIAHGPPRRLVGIRPDGRAPARAGTEITDANGAAVGRVTSGGFAPSLDAPVALGLVAAAQAEPGTPLNLLVRGKPLPARVVPLPFVPHRYAR